MKRLILIAIALVGILASGCQNNYFMNRKLDFLDCAQVNGGGTVGFGASVKFSDFATVRAIYSKGPRKGSYGRYHGKWEEQEIGIPFIASDRRLIGGGPKNKLRDSKLDYIDEMSVFVVAGKAKCWINGYKGPCKIELKPWYQLFNIEFGGTLGIVGGRVGLSLGEMLDFLVGIVGIDLAGDDKG